MPLHSGYENRQQRLQSLAAHPVGGFPKQDQCLIELMLIVSDRRLSSARSSAAITPHNHDSRT
jgi:hypothetical protein